MSANDLRPLGLGEILDRTFTLYRRNFVLFVGTAAIPHLLSTAFSLVQVNRSFDVVSTPPQNPLAALNTMFSGFNLAYFLSGIVISAISYILAQGGVVAAVSATYLGHTITIGQALSRAWGRFSTVGGAVVRNAIAVCGATLLLIIPGIWLSCRLSITVPCALIEGNAAFKRPFELTRGFAGRAFMIFLVYYLISIILAAPIGVIVGVMIVTHAGAPNTASLVLTAVLGSIVTFLVVPILYIAMSIFYYDLRVRKEGFDIQLMMNPGTETA